MPRARRSDLPTGPFHVICNAVHGERLFLDDLDRRYYVGLLQQTVEQSRWRVGTFVLMDTHLHMLLWTTPSRMSRGMWWLNKEYAGWCNARRSPRRGRLFGGPYRSIPITTEPYLLSVVRYVARNPVKAGLVERAVDYRWSADRAISGVAPPLPVVDVAGTLDLFSPDPARARREYRELVDGGPRPADDLVVRDAEGRPAQRPALRAVVGDGTSVQLAEAHRRWGYTVREIALHLEVHHTTVLRRIAGA